MTGKPSLLAPGLLAGRRIAVTGAAGGIGRSLCTVLSALGAHVEAVDRPSEALAKLAEPAVTARPCDLADPEARAALAASLGGEAGPLHGLVNNAGIFRRVRLPDDIDGATYTATVAVNALAADDLTRRLVPALREGEGASVVNIASVRGLTAPFSAAAYGLSKSAILVSTRRWSERLASEGVRVNAIAPGDIATPMNDAGKSDSYMTRIPLGRFAAPEEVARVAAFLLSSLSAGVSGVAWPVDGGFLAS